MEEYGFDIKNNLESGNSPQGKKDLLLEGLSISRNESDRGLDRTKPQTGSASLLVRLWIIGRWPVLILAILEIAAQMSESVESWEFWMENLFSPLLLLVELVVYGCLVGQVFRKVSRSIWVTTGAVLLYGFSLGLMAALFRVIWIRRVWTFYNLITEPVCNALIALIVGMVITTVLRIIKTRRSLAV